MVGLCRCVWALCGLSVVACASDAAVTGPHHGAHHGHGMPHRFEDAAAWAREFDAPERDSWQKPDDVIRTLNLAPNAVVADVGAGTGYFAVRLAKAVPQGRVVGIDIEADMVRFLNERAKKEGLANVQGRLSPPDRADIDEGTDLVLVVDTYHHIDNRQAWFAGLLPHLSAGGRLAIIDFRLDSERGPPRELKLAAEVVEQELKAAGFVLAASYDFLPEQYFLVFARR